MTTPKIKKSTLPTFILMSLTLWLNLIGNAVVLSAAALIASLCGGSERVIHAVCMVVLCLSLPACVMLMFLSFAGTSDIGEWLRTDLVMTLLIALLAPLLTLWGLGYLLLVLPVTSLRGKHQGRIEIDLMVLTGAGRALDRIMSLFHPSRYVRYV